jgi:two-component system, cell cycle response regulator DivK
MNGAKTVLIVEDNEDNRTIYSMLLRHYGYDVLEARDGEEGVRRAREARPDLVLMDVGLPRIDGWTATELLKSDEATARIPVIALTAHTLPEDRQRARAVGCDGFLAKPCEPRDLLQDIARFIGPGHSRVA